MRIEVLNQSGQKTVSALFLKKWIQKIKKELLQIKGKKKIKKALLKKKITLVFLKEKEMRRLNLRFRGKNKAADVLSFFADDKKALGEIALGPREIRRKARRAMLSPREMTAYLVLHGLLHLLGFRHEGSRKKAKEMFDLQDLIFESLKKKGL